MTKDAFVKEWNDKLTGILFRAYFTDADPPEMKYRRMKLDAERLEAALGKLFDSLHPENTNGRATTIPLAAGQRK
jgi:hypothetical protein